MYFYHEETVQSYQRDRQRELIRSMEDARYENAQITKQVGSLMERVGRWVADAGWQMRLERRQPALELLPVERHRNHR